MTGVAGGNHSAFYHRLQARQTFDRGCGAVALILLQGHVVHTLGLGLFVDEQHLRWQGDDFVIEFAGFLGGMGSLLTLQGIGILLLARNVIAFGYDLGRFQHGDIGMLGFGDDVWILGAVAVAMFVLHQGDGLETATDDDRHAITDNLFGGGGDSHHAGSALSIHAHAGDRTG